MSVPRVAVIPVGRMDVGEAEAALGRVSKVLHAPVELRETVPLPKGTEDAARGQHGSQQFLSAIRGELIRLKTTKLVSPDGVAAAPAGPPAASVAAVFVTDVDLFSPTTDAVISELDPAHRAAVVSVRRLREAFYRRKADPGKQRSRLVKEILRATGRLAGLSDCNDAGCSLAPTRSLADVDRKSEHYCAPCWKRMSAGTMRI